MIEHRLAYFHEAVINLGLVYRTSIRAFGIK
jgi:hypothetical protein